MKNLLRPKERYLAPADARAGEQTLAGRWADICVTPVYQQAVETALCEMVARLEAANLNDAAIVGYKLAGAKAFISILSNLGEPDRRPVSGGGTPQLTPV